MPSLHLLSQEDAIDEEVIEKSENPPKRTGSTLGNGEHGAGAVGNWSGRWDSNPRPPEPHLEAEFRGESGLFRFDADRLKHPFRQSRRTYFELILAISAYCARGSWHCAESSNGVRGSSCHLAIISTYGFDFHWGHQTVRFRNHPRSTRTISWRQGEPAALSV